MDAAIATFNALIERMRLADFYPHPVAEPIRLIQTHISAVLLTGEFAYKLKKPVNFEFADFSTLELRRHFLTDELNFNRRGAPGIYLNVFPITADPEGARLNGSGVPIEYVLQMRQFPQDSLLREMLANGRVDKTLIESLARTVADYHRDCPADPAIQEFGLPRVLKKIFDDNYAQTPRFPGAPLSAAQFDQIKNFTADFLTTHADALTTRADRGHVRRCHGDLHLGNICFWQNQLLLFDCIEFNPAFSCIDVLQDAAFTMMDLQASARPDLAWLFINAYLERTGDWDAVPLLPLYLLRHSFVRAKVNAILLLDPAVSEADKKSAAILAADYFRLAESYTQPRIGHIVVVCGLSGAGKSTLARDLATRRGAIHIRSDGVRKHLAGISIDTRGGPELYTPDMNHRTYARLSDLAVNLARAGSSVILDAKYDHRADRDALIAAAQRQHLPIRFIQCVAPLEVRHQRMSARASGPSDATADFASRQEGTFELFCAESPAPMTVWNT